MQLILKNINLLIAILFAVGHLQSQDKWWVGGALEMNINYFLEDSVIGASGTPQYNDNLIGGEAWLDLNTRYKGFRAGVRLDGFKNSNLLNPTGSYSDEGLGRFYLQQKYKGFKLDLGYLYDQIGSGIIFRSYEQRPLLIDNALVGGTLSYQINDDFSVKGFYGRQKQLFDIYPNTIRGVNIDGFFSFGEESPVTIAPGIGYINRVLSQDNMDQVIDILRTYVDKDRVIPKYNVYLGSIYNTLSYKGLIWYLEAAFKSSELYYDPNAIRTEITGTEVFGKYVKGPGSVWYSSISLAVQKLGITLEGKRTKNFDVRIDPLQVQNFGLMSFIPPMNNQLTYRLLSRYNPATQFLNEAAVQLDIQYAMSRKLKFQINISDIYTLDEDLLYREFYLSLQYKKRRKYTLNTGIQFMEYNQSVYEIKPEVDNVKTITPYVDFLYRFNLKNSIRTELQYMHTAQDYGSWIFGLVEIGLAPHWQFEISTMYNVSPADASPEDKETGEKLKTIYPTFGFTYTHGNRRINLRYVKQVEGVVCTGGICRLEPAFSGLRMSTYVNF